MSEKKPLSGGAILLGIILIVVGALVLLANLDILPFDLDLGHWWPLILIVARRGPPLEQPQYLRFFRALPHPARRGLPHGHPGQDLLGRRLALLAGGADPARPLHRLQAESRAPARQRGRRGAASSDPDVRVTNILAGTDRRINSQEFKGGDVSQHPGRHQDRPAGGQAGRRATGCSPCPPCWAASRSWCRATGASRSTRPACWAASTTTRGRTPDAGGGKLIIKASALLGGIEIKN